MTHTRDSYSSDKYTGYSSLHTWGVLHSAYIYILGVFLECRLPMGCPQIVGSFKL